MDYSVDPAVYWAIMFGTMIVAGLLMAWVQKKFSGTFKKYSGINSKSGMTGEQVAKKILRDNGINDVTVELGKDANTGDHFDPRKKRIVLSNQNYNSTSVAAIAVAAHEAGHAIQWNKNWIGIRVRNLFLAPAQIGSKLGWVTFFIGMIFWGATWGQWAMLAGFAMISMITVFQLVTLPVEFDASSRALKILKTDDYIGKNESSEEYAAAKKVLSAAAWTYVIGVVVSLLQLFRIFVMMMARRR